MKSSLRYQLEPALSVAEFREVLIASTLGERRPVNDEARLTAMLRHCTILITARADGLLVGVARSVSDLVYCTYLSDLAVHRDYQRRGIGRELIRQTHLAAPQAKLTLLAAPAAESYYPRIGMEQFVQCYRLTHPDQLL